MMKRFIILLVFFSFAFAHNGFNKLSWQESLGAYTVTILEDFHPAEGKFRALIQLSEGKQAVPEGTEVEAKISFEDTLIFEGKASFISNSSQDGNLFYSAYVLDADISQEGLYSLELSLSGPLGDVSKSYFVQAQNENRVSPLEYLPSALILLISVGGVLILFLPVQLRKDSYETPEINRSEFAS